MCLFLFRKISGGFEFWLTFFIIYYLYLFLYFLFLYFYILSRIKLSASHNNRALFENTQLAGCIAILSICDERGGGRGKQARKAGAVEVTRAACEYFQANCPRTEQSFSTAKVTLKRMDKKCSIA